MFVYFCYLKILGWLLRGHKFNEIKEQVSNKSFLQS